MNDGYGPWIEWAQGPRPVEPDQIVLAEMGHAESGDIIGPLPAIRIDWNCPHDPVARYKVRRYPALTVDTVRPVEVDA